MDKTVKEIILNGKKYNCIGSFSIGSYSRATKVIEETGDYKEAFKLLVLDKFETVSIDELELFSDEDYLKIINLFLDKNNSKDIFDSFIHENIFKDFFDAVQENLCNKFKPILKDFSKVVGNFYVSLNNDISSNISTLLNNFSEKISNFFKSLKIDEENVKEPLKKWALYGWTIPDEAPINLFFVEPADQDEADSLCMKFFNDSIIEKMFNNIKSNADIIDSYVDESNELFKLGYYRSCAFLLLSIIDKVFSSNIILDKGKYKKQIVSDKRVNDIKEKITKNKDEIILDIFLIYNFFDNLNLFFADGKDFDNEPNNVNRNFLMHGWQFKEITKIDCIKLLNTCNILVNNIDKIKNVFDLYKQC